MIEFVQEITIYIYFFCIINKHDFKNLVKTTSVTEIMYTVPTIYSNSFIKINNFALKPVHTEYTYIITPVTPRGGAWAAY